MEFPIIVFYVLPLLALTSVKAFDLMHSHTSSIDGTDSVLYPSQDTYLMKLWLGNPAFETYAIMDTGSDLLWIKCAPCEECQLEGPVFDPRKSETYVACAGPDSCTYNYSYADSSMTEGVMARDTLSFTSRNQQGVAVRDILFGCGHRTAGNFPPQATGVIGLGRGKLSLITQLGVQKFSYCLSENKANSSGLLQIGDAVITGKSSISTPLLKGSIQSFYYIRLEGVSVGGKKLLNGEVTSRNIFIDSGTTLTYLEPALYQSLETMVIEMIPLKRSVYQLPGIRLCYDKDTLNNISDIKITFHFGEADVVLNKVNLFITDDISSLSCLAILPSKDNNYVYGNIAQINFQVVYDLGRSQVSFAPVDCRLLHEQAPRRSQGQRLVGRQLLLPLMVALFIIHI